MTLVSILLLGLAMATDAFAAALGKGAAMARPRWDEALRIGLVNAIYPVDELYAAAEKMAATIAANAPIAVRAAKKAINEGYDMDMDAAVALEAKVFKISFESEDQQEGMGAFLEKRKHAPFMNK